MSIVYVVIYNVASVFILKSDPKIYSFVPQDANQVIEVNVKEFILKTTDQFFYNKDYALPYFNKEESGKNPINKTKGIGIDLTSKLIFFSEFWEGKTIWYCIVGIDNGSKFSEFAKKREEIIAYEVISNFAICLLTEPLQKENVYQHLKQIANQKVKSFDSKIDLSTKFNSANEINYYVSPEDNDYIIDGFLVVNFNGETITFEGEYNTVGSLDVLSSISQPIKPNSAFSLRTTFNYFGDIPGFNELSVDYEGTDFVTSNAVIPLHVLPNLNVYASSGQTNYWKDFFDKIDSYDKFTVDSSIKELRYLNQLNFSVGYEFDNTSFRLSNDSVLFDYRKDIEFNSNNVLELKIIPDLYFSEINFVNDELNSPKMIANLKINMFKNIVTEFSSINKIEEIYCSVNYSKDKTKLISKGEVKFKEKKGHSIIESLFMGINALKAVEMFSKFQ
jgi:hypothetical protein